MAHRHHNGTGTPHIVTGDVFTLVARPLHSSPKHFIGMHPTKGVRTVGTASCAKRVCLIEAHAWLDMLAKQGHEFFLCTYEPKVTKPRIRVLREEKQ
jgi:hypothetical protein